MKKGEIKIGGTYLAKVSDKVVPVRIDAESRHGGWDATNMSTNKKVRIKSAQRLRGEVNAGGKQQAAKPEPSKAEPSKRQVGTATAEKNARKPRDPAKPKKVSLLDAAAQVLAESAEPMTAKQMVDAVTAKGLWSSPKGKTPHATLYAAILRETGAKGADARFRKTDRGLFAAANK
jgi:hypothetical protein